MSWQTATFEVLCWLSLIAVIAYFVTLSLRDRRVHPGIWLTIGILSISWLEAPYDQAMYVQFNPELHRLPAWGPIGATQGGLPVIAPPGYVMYFLVPGLLAVGIANVAVRRWNLRRSQTLVAVGFLVGATFDAIMQFGQSQLIPLWVFSRTAPGLTAFPGLQQQIPVYDLLAMGFTVMWATYILGQRDRGGSTVIDRWVQRRTPQGWRRTVVTASAYVVFMHAVYLYVLAPHYILYKTNLLAQSGVLQPFPEIPVQPAHAQHDGAIGAMLILGWLVVGIVATYVLVRRVDHPDDRESPHVMADGSAAFSSRR